MEGTGHRFQKVSPHWHQTWTQSRQEEFVSLKDLLHPKRGEDVPPIGLFSSEQLSESLEVVRGHSG